MFDIVIYDRAGCTPFLFKLARPEGSVSFLNVRPRTDFCYTKSCYDCLSTTVEPFEWKHSRIAQQMQPSRTCAAADETFENNATITERFPSVSGMFVLMCVWSHALYDIEFVCLFDNDGIVRTYVQVAYG